MLSRNVNIGKFSDTTSKVSWKDARKKEQAVRKAVPWVSHQATINSGKATVVVVFNFLLDIAARMTQSNGSLSKWPRSELEGLTSQTEHFLAKTDPTYRCLLSPPWRPRCAGDVGRR